jgi:hypothetical protein
MIFQVLDDKRHCASFYINGEIFFEEPPKEASLTATWAHSPHISGDVRYAQLYANGVSLSESCPEEYLDEWNNISHKMRAFMKSFETSKVSLDENCIYDLIPKKFLMEHCELKNIICKHVLENYEKPSNYEFLADVAKVLSSIERRKLNLNFKNLGASLSDPYIRAFWKKHKDSEQFIRYNLFGTKTGRLSTTKTSFPIHNLKKELRPIIEPVNDYLVEFDFNAAELRTLLSLSDIPQPVEDIHDWNVNNIFLGSMTREDAKKKVFSWLYNPDSKDMSFNKFYDRDKVCKKYYSNGVITTHFGRRIESDDRHALNYIIQSTTSDLLLKRMVELDKSLKSMKSFISFTVHDNIVLDMSADELYLIPELVKKFSDTELGKYRANMSVGKNYGNMRGTTKWTQ